MSKSGIKVDFPGALSAVSSCLENAFFVQGNNTICEMTGAQWQATRLTRA